MNDTKWAHEWVAKRSEPNEMRCRVCGTIRWRTAQDQQPPCDGDTRIVDGMPVQIIRPNLTGQ